MKIRGWEAKLPDGIFDPDFFLYRSHKLKDKDEQYKEKKFLQNINTELSQVNIHSSSD